MGNTICKIYSILEGDECIGKNKTGDYEIQWRKLLWNECLCSPPNSPPISSVSGALGM